MNMPTDYNTVAAYGDFTPLVLGGHVCKVMSVEETISSTQKAMLKINLDVAEGEQKDYYATLFRADTRENKKWGCIVYQLTNDSEGNTHRGLKTFITAVENSNSGFKVVWGDSFCQTLKGKLIGGVFGREQYENRDYELKFSTKCTQFRSVESIKKGVEVPEDKLLKGQKKQNVSSTASSDFTEIGTDDDLPF
jgi:fructose-bisphosphate aldolase class 1